MELSIKLMFAMGPKLVFHAVSGEIASLCQEEERKRRKTTSSGWEPPGLYQAKDLQLSLGLFAKQLG